MKIVKKFTLGISILLICTFSAMSHPFYVSICQIDHNKQNNSLEISVKIFADDFLKGLADIGARKLYLGEKRESSETNKYIEEYIKRNLQIRVNGEKINLSFIGKEMETDVVWSYFEAVNVKQLNEIEVDCTILTEIYDTQSNIIQVNAGNGIRSMLLNRRKTTDSIEL